MIAIFLKTLGPILLPVSVVVVAGLTGLTFYMWPTTFPDHTLRIIPEIIAELRSLQAERKFSPDPAHFYPGAPNEAQRLSAQVAVDMVIQSLLIQLPLNPRRSMGLDSFKAMLANFSTQESEERDRVLIYLERTMEIMGAQESSERPNVWRFGFPYGWIFGHK